MTTPGSETLFDEMKRYVRWSEADAAALAALGAHARARFPAIAAQFYERIREHEDAHAVFRDEEQIERLKRTLVRWLERLCSGPHDEDYFLERARIGRIHVAVGLPQRYMFTAMALIRADLDQAAAELADPVAAQRALARILDLELAIMLETYRDDHVARLERAAALDRSDLQRALAASERRYVNAVELARVIVVGVDGAGAIALFNREAERVTGRSRDEVLGTPFVELLHDEDRGAVPARFIAARADAPVERWEVRIVNRAGRSRTVELQLAHVPGDGIDLFAVGSDVTDARAMQARALQSEKLAAVGTLAAGLAHEIRNPLNGALLHVTFLERALAKQAASADSLEAVKLVGDELRRLSALVKDFLVFARPSTPKLAAIPLRVIAERVVGIVAPEAATASAHLVADPGASEIVLEIDGPKIEQALLNLVRNAIEAVGSQGGGKVMVRIRRQPRIAHLEVEDDGPGLSSPDAPIFDAFFSTKAQGTGLGLAIVHRIVSDHGGTITFESRPGRTVFRIALPIDGVALGGSPETGSATEIK